MSEARAALPEVLDRVLTGEEVTITRHGRPVAVVVRPDRLRARRAEGAVARAAPIGDIVSRGRRAPLRAPVRSPERAEELVTEVRAARAKR